MGTANTCEQTKTQTNFICKQSHMNRELEEDAEGNDDQNQTDHPDDEEKESLEEEEDVDPRSLLTKEQIQSFKSIFDEFDPNQKERIPTKTIGFVLRLMGLNPTKADIRRHMVEIDPGGKGLIDFQSFLLPIAQRINQEPETHEDIIAAFRVFDEEENEFVDNHQLIEYLTNLGEDLEDFEVEVFLKTADPKGTGRVAYVEFVEKMMGIVRKTPKGKGDKGKKGKKK